jgi:hypothetical protein
VSEATGVRDVAVDLVVSFCTIDRAYGFLKGTLPAIRDARVPASEFRLRS